MKIHKIRTNIDKKHTYDIEVPDVHEYVLGNNCISHNTSGQIIQATEGIEPIKRLVQMKEGTYTLPVLVPNLQKNRQYYQSAFDIPNKTLNKLNSIRQAFIDQSQSFSHYYRETDSSYEILTDILDAEALGIKSLYYLQPMKSDDIEGCESCSS